MYVTICSERLKNLVRESANWHAALAAALDSWQQYKSIDWPTDTDVDILYNDAVRLLWQTQLPTKPVRNALLRWCAGRPSYKYALVFSDFNTDNVVMFYDEEDNELTFTIGDDAWLELPDEPT